MVVRVAQKGFVPLALAAVVVFVGLVACKPVRCAAGTSSTGTTCLPDGGSNPAAIGGDGQAGIDPNASLAVAATDTGTGGVGAGGDPAAGADQSGWGIPAGQGSSGYGGADPFGSAGISGAGTPGAPPADPQQTDPAAPGISGGPCAASEVTCDGLDNDCDTLVDEAIVRPCGPPDATGICASGAETCIAGAWGPCEGAVEPLPMEICDPDRLDENCNGTNNEGCGCIDGETQPCGKDQGLCKPGTQTCAGGTWSAQCDGAVDPKQPEACDQARQDEDCDGLQNELCLCTDGEKRACGKDKGLCKPGMQTCAGGIWGECAGAVDPNRPEACDEARQDEDCDGAMNEDCLCIDGKEEACPPMQGACDPGRHKCERGTWGACTGIVTCPSNQRCVEGKCQCVPTRSCDQRECGADDCGVPCGRDCPTGERAGTCYTGECGDTGTCGFLVNTQLDCARDQDGDGVPATGSARSCLGECPSGLDLVDSTSEPDCDDGDGTAFPGNSDYYADGRDHNCDGRLTPIMDTVAVGCETDTCDVNSGCAPRYESTGEQHCGGRGILCGADPPCDTPDTGGACIELPGIPVACK